MVDPHKETWRRLVTFASLPVDYVRNRDEMKRALADFILSVSGWRKIFAASEQDGSPQVNATHREIVAAAGKTYADFLKKRSNAARPILALATDSRPTGPAIASILARVLLSENITVRYAGICAAPEIMAYVRRMKLDGFIYVSASHNPIGHNGLKFGLSDGGVIAGPDARIMVLSFKQLIRDAERCRKVVDRARSRTEAELETLDNDAASWKREVLDAYLEFTLEVGTMAAEAERREPILEAIRTEAARRKIGIISDFNGSARSLSIDRTFLGKMGVHFEAINDKPGQIVHMIVPEGPALEPCRRELERLHAKEPGFLLGYMPDNDGDRGNIVYVDPRSGKAATLHAQEVFALSCVAELSFLVYNGKLTYTAGGKSQQRHAVVVNGPTSLRVDAIAKAFDVQVFRSEVGEANVVGLARDSRNSGFHVRFMGEGSNGGNITHPSRVRDPLATIFAFLKLLLIRSKPGRPGLYEIWCKRSGHPFDADAGIREMLDSLPRYVTTEVNDPRAIVDIKVNDHVRFKEAYEEIFLAEWDARRTELAEELGVDTWEEINYEGMSEIHGFGKSYRRGKQRGGLKILFKDSLGRKLAFIWMRGSGTEPVFRVLADVEGDDPELERKLLDWHVAMIRRADTKVSALLNASR